MCNSSFSNGTCSFSERRLSLSSSVSILSTSMLTVCAFAGTSFNAKALLKIFSRYQLWKTKVSLIQLVVVSSIFTAIFCPFEIVCIWLGWYEYEFLIACGFHHFFKLLADSCTFVTTVMISYERLQKIINRYPIDEYINYKRAIGLCSWLLIIPFSVYFVYEDVIDNETLSIFSILCTINTLQTNTPDIISQIVSSSLFFVSFVFSCTMYFFGIRTLWKQSNSFSDLRESHLRPTHFNLVDMNRRLSTPVRLNTSINSDALNESNVSGNSRSTSTFSRNSEKEGSCVLMTDAEIHYHTERLRDKHNATLKSVVDDHSNDSKSDEEVDIGSLNPLRHTRRSAGNAWFESDSSISSRQSFPPRHRSSSLNKGNKLKKKSKRLKKQHSVDSFGAVSMTSEHSNASFISDTGSDYGSRGVSPDGNTKNQMSLDQCQDKISIIFEQPEYDKESPYLNASKSKLSKSKKCSTKSFGISENYNDQKYRSQATATYINNTQSLSGSEGVSNTRGKKALAEKNNSFDNTKLSCTFKEKYKGARLIQVKSIEDIDDGAFKSDFIIRRKAKSEENLGSSSSIFGDENGAPRPGRIRTRSFDTGTVRQITHDNMIPLTDKGLVEWNNNFHRVSPFRLSSSMINLTTNYSKRIDTRSETANEVFTSNEQFDCVPAIRIIRPSIQAKHYSPRRCDYVRPRKRPKKKNGNDSVASSEPVQACFSAMSVDSRTQIKTNSKSTINTVKRSLLIMGAFALAYCPSFLVVAMRYLNLITVQALLDWFQITKSIQYMYFGFVPIIYVYTNKGLLKTLNQIHKG